MVTKCIKCGKEHKVTVAIRKAGSYLTVLCVACYNDLINNIR
jgi:hypothetical protein